MGEALDKVLRLALVDVATAPPSETYVDPSTISVGQTILDDLKRPFDVETAEGPDGDGNYTFAGGDHAVVEPLGGLICVPLSRVELTKTKIFVPHHTALRDGHTIQVDSYYRTNVGPGTGHGPDLYDHLRDGHGVTEMVARDARQRNDLQGTHKVFHGNEARAGKETHIHSGFGQPKPQDAHKPTQKSSPVARPEVQVETLKQDRSWTEGPTSRSAITHGPAGTALIEFRDGKWVVRTTRGRSWSLWNSHPAGSEKTLEKAAAKAKKLVAKGRPLRGMSAGSGAVDKIVELASGRVYVPGYEKVQDGKTVHVDGYWRAKGQVPHPTVKGATLEVGHTPGVRNQGPITSVTYPAKSGSMKIERGTVYQFPTARGVFTGFFTGGVSSDQTGNQPEFENVDDPKDRRYLQPNKDVSQLGDTPDVVITPPADRVEQDVTKAPAYEKVMAAVKKSKRSADAKDRAAAKRAASIAQHEKYRSRARKGATTKANKLPWNPNST